MSTRFDQQETSNSCTEIKDLRMLFEGIDNEDIKKVLSILDKNIFDSNVQVSLVSYCFSNNRNDLLKCLFEFKDFDFNLKYGVLF